MLLPHCSLSTSHRRQGSRQILCNFSSQISSLLSFPELASYTCHVCTFYFMSNSTFSLLWPSMLSYLRQGSSHSCPCHAHKRKRMEGTEHSSVSMHLPSFRKNLTSTKPVPRQGSSVGRVTAGPQAQYRFSVVQCIPLSDHYNPEMSTVGNQKTQNRRTYFEELM